jgi:hypothetical protein
VCLDRQTRFDVKGFNKNLKSWDGPERSSVRYHAVERSNVEVQEKRNDAPCFEIIVDLQYTPHKLNLKEGLEQRGF